MDSVATVPDFKSDEWITFRFDEVIQYGSSPDFGRGTGDFERLILLSPDTQVPRVRWVRDGIQVRPRSGWQRDRVYRVELLPGVRDLWENATTRSVVLTLSTGEQTPNRFIRGAAVDWQSRNWLSNALVEVFFPVDSLTYRGSADSTGQFNFGPLPDGEALVRVIADRNSDRRRNGNEPWTELRLSPGQDSTGELWAFLQDTLPPRISGEVAQRDTLTLRVQSTLPLDTLLTLASDSIRLLRIVGRDSLRIAVLGAWVEPLNDSLFPRILPKISNDSLAGDSLRTSTDSTGAGADTLSADRRNAVTQPADTARQAPAPPQTKHMKLSSSLIIRLPERLEYESQYFLELSGVRALAGKSGTFKTAFRTGKAPAPRDSNAVAKDTIGADSLGLPPDSVPGRPDLVRNPVIPLPYPDPMPDLLPGALLRPRKQ